ncbi:hypothetical protein GCM10011591_44750 [Nocardia camponoti]|uniref:ESAT-6-like protein n=1 Tax=Nocardia camponoti TaxID=1616106 RepID=A0A917QTD3_9NOCA|nr:hypothetical protein GCM10011591_44750 [Nocardia camponoti]
MPDDVTDAGAYVQQVAESLINGLNSLDREITGVLSNWTGGAATAFSGGWSETKEGAATVLNALATMAELLGATSKAFVSQDTVNAAGLSSLNLPKLNI